VASTVDRGSVAARPIPLQGGIGLRAPHHDVFLARRPQIPWVEVHSENFFADGGRALTVLDAVRRDYELSLHGVGLSLGSTDPLSTEHLGRLKRLANRCAPALVSEHLAWGSVGGVYVNDLLPLPYTKEALEHMVGRVQVVQETLGRDILIENISGYVQFTGADYTEWDFLVELARRSGCGVLLDINNIYVSSRNLGFDPHEYLAGIPASVVREIHLAGHTVVTRDDRPVLIDTHSAPVAAPVAALYREAISRIGPVPTLIEWDAELPSLDELIHEARRADGWQNEALVLRAEDGHDRAA